MQDPDTDLKLDPDRGRRIRRWDLREARAWQDRLLDHPGACLVLALLSAIAAWAFASHWTGPRVRLRDWGGPVLWSLAALYFTACLVAAWRRRGRRPPR